MAHDQLSYAYFLEIFYQDRRLFDSLFRQEILRKDFRINLQKLVNSYVSDLYALCELYDYVF